MDTRIIHTKIHFEDDWFNSMPFEYKYLFIYLFTNQHIRQTGIYQLTERVALIETKAPEKTWRSAIEYFVDCKKVGVFKDWFCIANALKHTNYSGPKNETAFINELKKIPQEIIKYFTDTLSIPYIYPIDTTINHKSEIINPKEEAIDLDELDKGISEMKVK